MNEKDIKKRCENCKSYRRLKHNYKVGTGYEDSYCCLALLKLNDGVLQYPDEDGTVAWVQEVEPDSMCEMFVPRERKAE